MASEHGNGSNGRLLAECSKHGAEIEVIFREARLWYRHQQAQDAYRQLRLSGKQRRFNIVIALALVCFVGWSAYYVW